MKYKIEITETYSRVVEVEAESVGEAFLKAGTLYDKGEIKLEAKHKGGYELKEFEEVKKGGNNESKRHKTKARTSGER